MTKKTRRNARRALLALSLVLVTMMVTVGGTIAWLTATSDDVVNTFTPSDVDITLSETAGLDLKMVPGKVITKDPEVTVAANSEDCYVFVKVVPDNGYGTFFGSLTAETFGSKWKVLSIEDGTAVIYYSTEETDTPTSVSKNAKLDEIIKNDSLTVLSTVTKTDMSALYDEDGNVKSEDELPNLTFTAYAVQSAHLPTDLTNAQIWTLAQGNALQ